MTTGVGKNVTISGTGTLQIGGNTINGTAGLGILIDNTDAYTLTLNAPVTLGGSAETWTNNSGNLFTLGGTLNLATKILTVNGSGNTTISGVVSNGTLTKSGTGTLTLSNTADTYTGQLTVQAGTLSIDTINNASANGELGNNALSVILGNTGSSTGTLEYTGGTASSTKKFTMATGGTGAFQIDTAGTTLTLSGVIDGSGALNKTGAGTLVLSGANTYTGKTSIQNGALSVSSLNKVTGGSASSSLGAPTTVANGTIDIGSTTNSGTLIYTGLGETTDRVINLAGTTGGAVIQNDGSGAVTFSSNLTATGAGSKTLTLQGSNTGSSTISGAIVDNSGSNTTALTKAGAGTWVLSGANTYSGGTTVSAGTLQLSGSGTLGSTSGSLTVNGGTLDLNGTSQGVGNLTGSGGTILNNATLTNVTLTIGNGNGTGGNYSGVIADHSVGIGTVALTKTGTGTITLSGANTYSGKTSIQNGTLSVSSINKVIGGSLSSNLGAPLTAANGTIDFGSTTNTGTLIYTGSGETTDRVINLAGTTGGAVLENDGSGALTFSSNLTATGAGSKTFTLQGSNSGSNTISGIIVDNSSSNTTAVTKAGAGEWILSGVNTYTGGTTLSVGTLQLSGSGTLGSTSGSLVVNGGTLDLNGTTQGVGNFTGSGGTILNNSTGTNVTFTIGNGNGTGGNYAGVIADHTSGTGTVALTKSGTGTITLSGANTYSGLTTVSAGVLNIQNATALGTTTNGTSVTSGATLQIQGGITVGAEALTLNGSGASGQNGALVNVSGTNNYGGLVTLGSASTISSDSGTLNLTNSGTITGATFGLALTGAGNGSVSSVIGTTTGTLTKNGAGAWTLTGANTYTGGTTVNAGSLFINNTSGSGTGTGAITVTGSGTTLGGNGTMSGAVSVASGNNLAPGASGVGSTAVLKTGALTLSSGSNFQVDINGTTVGTGYDQLGVTNGASIAGSNLLITLGTTFTQSDVGDKFAILSNITAGLVSGTFSGLSEGASFNSGSDQFMITYVGNAGDGTNGNDIVLTLTAVPEPSTWLAAALALGAVGYMQRRRLRGSSRHRRQER